jgi:TonB family protein
MIACAGLAGALLLQGCALGPSAAAHDVAQTPRQPIIAPGPLVWRYVAAPSPASASVSSAAGSAAGSKAPAAAPKPPPVSPFSDAPVSFLIHGQFVRGELVIVRVCLRADRSIASSEVIESSGDSRFDEMAAQWARRVQLRSQPPVGVPVARCGAVRVELHDAPEPRVIPGGDNLLG